MRFNFLPRSDEKPPLPPELPPGRAALRAAPAAADFRGTFDGDNGVPCGCVPISDAEFATVQGLFKCLSGIYLPPEKKSMVSSRLSRRLRHFGLSDFAAYLELVSDGRHHYEQQWMVDLLTTHETYFFREPKHFDFLRDKILAEWPAERSLRVWSAAASTGEESYSIAMVLAERLGAAGPWEVFGSDIAHQSLLTARTALYPIERSGNIPEQYLRNYCRKGVRAYEGSFLIARELRERTRFMELKLNEELPEIGQFDVVFLRNVLIYFDAAMKRRIVERVASRLRPGGWLIVGHAEGLHNVGLGKLFAAEKHAPSIYRKGGG